MTAFKTRLRCYTYHRFAVRADPEVESKDVVAARIRRALEVLPKERVIVAPDCGMKYLTRSVAFGKLKAMVEGAQIVRRELSGASPAG